MGALIAVISNPHADVPPCERVGNITPYHRYYICLIIYYDHCPGNVAVGLLL
uniref:Uncharacterized protein n=1 Tax=Anguilla anguilla TaxID=7936 RepID=A0A0E9P8U9_ANGAN